MARKAEIQETRQALNFKDLFKVDELVVTHEQLDGTMSKPQTRLVFERGDAAAVLLLNLDSKSVVLVEQFKVPTLVARRRDDPATTDGWVTETVAGMVDPGETPEQTAIRETEEESGYRIRRPKLISTFFSSPGGTSERIFLYYAEVRNADRVEKGGGIDDEDIKVVEMPVEELLDRLAKGSIDDPKLLIGAYWLDGHLRSRVALQLALGDPFERLGKGAIADPKLVAALASAAPAAAPTVASGALPTSTIRYALKHKQELSVGIKTGIIAGIKGVHSVDLWVNSENTDMMMDRFLGKSISANIRYLGANKEGDSVIEDTIEEELRSAVGRRGHVRIGTVLVTTSGQLRAAPHKVRRIFHVATVEGGAGRGVKADPEKLQECVVNLLKRVDHENNHICRWLLRKQNFESILIPMFGAGDGRVPVEEVAEKIIPPAVEYFQSTETPTLRAVYFLAYAARDRNACTAVLERYCADGVLIRPGED